MYRQGLFILLWIVVLSGCSGTKLAPTNGKVTFNGAPVTAGSITLIPEGGSEGSAVPASGDIGPDGAFTLTTEHPGDGACVGHHAVSFSPPVLEPAQPGQAAPASGLERLVPREVSVEIKPGENTLNIELVRAS